MPTSTQLSGAAAALAGLAGLTEVSTAIDGAAAAQPAGPAPLAVQTGQTARKDFAGLLANTAKLPEPASLDPSAPIAEAIPGLPELLATAPDLSDELVTQPVATPDADVLIETAEDAPAPDVATPEATPAATDAEAEAEPTLRPVAPELPPVRPVGIAEAPEQLPADENNIQASAKAAATPNAPTEGQRPVPADNADSTPDRPAANSATPTTATPVDAPDQTADIPQSQPAATIAGTPTPDSARDAKPADTTTSTVRKDEPTAPSALPRAEQTAPAAADAPKRDDARLGAPERPDAPAVGRTQRETAPADQADQPRPLASTATPLDAAVASPENEPTDAQPRTVAAEASPQPVAKPDVPNRELERAVATTTETATAKPVVASNGDATETAPTSADDKIASDADGNDDAETADAAPAQAKPTETPRPKLDSATAAARPDELEAAKARQTPPAQPLAAAQPAADAPEQPNIAQTERPSASIETVRSRDAAPEPSAPAMEADAAEAPRRAEPIILPGQAVAPDDGDALSRPQDPTAMLAGKRFASAMAQQAPAAQVAFSIARSAGEAPDRIRMQLYPQELGQVEIVMDVQEDRRADVVVRAERPETVELLQRDARELQRALQAAGLDVGSDGLNFELGGQSRDGDAQGHGEGSNGSDGANDADEQFDRFAPPSAPTWRVQTPGGVDLLA